MPTTATTGAAQPRTVVPPGVRSVLPGLALVALATGIAFGVSAVVPGLNASTVGVLLGAVAVNTGLVRPWARAGTGFAAKRLLRLAVVLLGLQLAVGQLAALGFGGLAVVLVTVAVTFFGTQLIARAAGLSGPRGLLIATGFSICGASAVAAMEPVAGGEEEDTSIAVALVTICGSLAILVLPLLQGPLGLDTTGFGAWVGASVHDVGQTVATAERVPGSLTEAVVVKLTRVVLLAPLVAGVAVAQRRRGVATVPPGGRRPPLLPLFVAGFLAAVVLRSTGVVPTAVVDGAHAVQGVLLAAALFGLGTGIRLRSLARTGGRSVLVGLASWVLVAVVAYAGVRLLGR